PTDGRVDTTRRPVSWLAGLSPSPRLPGFPVAQCGGSSPLTVAGAAAESEGLAFLTAFPFHPSSLLPRGNRRWSRPYARGARLRKSSAELESKQFDFSGASEE